MTAASSVNGSIQTIPSVALPSQYSTSDKVLAMFKEKTKDVIKGMGYLAFWANEAVPNLPSSVSEFGSFTSKIKNVISVTELPEKVSNVMGSMQNVAKSLKGKINGEPKATWGAVGGVARKAFFEDLTGVISTTNDTLDLARSFKVISMSDSTKQLLGGIGLGATVIGSGNDIVKNVEKLCTEKDPHQTKVPLFLMKIASSVSYLALGVIGLYGIFAAAAIAPWIFVACLTSALTFTLASFFWEKTYDPEGKGLNLQPAPILAQAAKLRLMSA